MIPERVKSSILVGFYLRGKKFSLSCRNCYLFLIVCFVKVICLWKNWLERLAWWRMMP